MEDIVCTRYWGYGRKQNTHISVLKELCCSLAGSGITYNKINQSIKYILSWKVVKSTQNIEQRVEMECVE